MKFTVADEIFKKYPDLNIGLLVAKGINNKGKDQEVLEMIANEIISIKQNHVKENLSQNPKIEAWRRAFSEFGAKPKNYKCSVENLYRMILDDIELKSINRIVDIYNYISLKYMIPAGGDDIDKIEGDITLKIANGDEKFVQLNTDEVKHPKEGEVIYSDDKEVLCRRWNWRECDKSKMTEDTENVALVVEGLSPLNIEDVELILNDLSSLVQKYCGGSVQTFTVNKFNNGIEI